MAYGACLHRKNMKDGGRVHGPGTPTSDSVKINASRDEYVLPADTTRKVGARKLDALVAATHEPVHAGAKKGRNYANGGLVVDENDPNDPKFLHPSVRTIAAPPAPAPGAYASTADVNSAIGAAARSALPAGGALANTTDAAGAAVPVSDAQPDAGSGELGGAIARGVGSVIKTLVSAPGYGMNSDMIMPGSLAPVGAGAGRGFVNPQAVTPSAQAPAAPAPPPVAPLAAEPAAASAAPAVNWGVTPGTIKKTVLDANGRPEKVITGGQPTAATAPALGANDPLKAQRDAFDYIASVAAPGDPRSVNHRIARLAQAYGVGGVGTTQERQNQQNMQAPEQIAKNELAIDTATARKAYADALSGGDVKKIAKAETRLRGVQGKYEKDDKPVRHLVVQGGQQIVDGQLVHQPSVVFNPDTGQFLTPPLGAGVQPPLPPGMTKQVGYANGKPVYEDAKGKRFTGS